MWLLLELHALEDIVMPRIGVRDLKTHASEVMRDVRENRARYVVTHRGEPVGVIVPYSPKEEVLPLTPDESWSQLFAALDALGKSWNTPLTSIEVLDEMRR
jgi:prevent-host-death family protein